LLLFKRGNHAAVSNYRPVYILSNFSKLFEFIIHDHVSHYAKFNPNQHGFSSTTSKSTVTNLVMLLDFMTTVVCGQRQADSVYFDLSNAFNLDPHIMLLHKLSSFGFSRTKQATNNKREHDTPSTTHVHIRGTHVTTAE
jgi:hypothetical protein